MNILVTINHYLWDYLLVFLLTAVGVYFTVSLRGVQIRRFFSGTANLFRPTKRSKKVIEISSFQALAASIAAQIGTGNLAGAATAIVAGGPGAIFWMWLSAFFSMATIFAEATLAQVYRQKVGDEMLGGPAYYIRYGLGFKKLAAFFAVAIILALGFVGNMVQANSIALAFEQAFAIQPIFMGIIISILAWLIFRGGVVRIMSFAEKTVPFMALFYFMSCLIILICRAEYIGTALQLIFQGAFNPSSIGGGLLGFSVKEAIRYGVARGLFSNEAGMGSTPHAHAAARVAHPCQQGEIAIFSVFIDTFVMLTLTALVIISAPFYLTMIKGSPDSHITGIQLTQAVFLDSLGSWGNSFIAVVLFFFGFTTIVGWYYFALTNAKYLFGPKSTKLFTSFVLLFIVMGSTLHVNFVWELADTFNAVMCLPNLLALFLLRKVVVNKYRGLY